jgi:hypothetical protein
VHALTVLDDHWRFALGGRACANEQATTVQAELTAIFQRYGMPAAILCDNGAPWGDAGDQPDTRLGAWLLRYGVQVWHGRPRHPQTQGKDERFHRTLLDEAVRDHLLLDLPDRQRRFDRFRHTYNVERPHQALGYRPPAACYQPSPRPFPPTPPPIEDGPDDLVRKVGDHGRISIHGRRVVVGRAFIGYPVALRPTTTEGIHAVSFCVQQIGSLDLRQPTASSSEVSIISPNTC